MAKLVMRTVSAVSAATVGAIVLGLGMVTAPAAAADPNAAVSRAATLHVRPSLLAAAGSTSRPLGRVWHFQESECAPHSS